MKRLLILALILLVFMPAIALSSPTKVMAGVLPDKTVQVWKIDNSALSTRWKVNTDPGAAWTDWQAFQGTSGNGYVISFRDISWVPLPNGIPQLFAVSTDGNIYTCWKVSTTPGAAWTGWQLFQMPPNVKVIHMSGAPLPNGVPQLFAVANNGMIYTCWKVSTDPGAQWTNWGLY